MKKKLLFLALTIASLNVVKAQCTIVGCSPSSWGGYCSEPVAGENLPDAEVGVPYSTVVQFTLGWTASSGAILITSATLVGFTSPSGFSINMNPSSGSLAAGEAACFEIVGTPTAEVVDTPISIDAVVVTNTGIVTQTLTWYLTINPSTAGIEEKEKSFSVYPNPSHSNITINLTEPSQVTIYSVLGAAVVSTFVNTSENIDISNLENGIYYVVNVTTGVKEKLLKY